MPGWIEESVGYHTDDGNIFHNADDPDAAIITEGRKHWEQHTTARLALLSEHRSAHPRRPRGSQSSREKRWDESFQVRAEEPLGTDSHRTISKNLSGCTKKWAQKNAFRVFVHDGYCLNHGLSGSCTKEMHAVRKLSVWYKIPIWFQNTVCPKTKDTFPKIQAWAYNRYSHLHLSLLA